MKHWASLSRRTLPSGAGGSLDACKTAFLAKFKDKTGNTWANKYESRIALFDIS